MNILLTGSSGFLGKIILNEISKFNSVDTLNRNSGTYNCDLSIGIPNISKKYDLVIHAAGVAHNTSKTLSESSVFHNINVIGTENLLKGLEKGGIPSNFLFISTAAVYGLVSGKNIDENVLLLAKEPYGKSKIDCEKLIIEWCKKNRVVYTILRLPIVIGSNPTGNVGELIKGIKSNYYFTIAGGKAKKSMVLATDVAKYLIKASEIGGIYNLTDGYHPSIYELSYLIHKQVKSLWLPNMPLSIAKLLAIIGDKVTKKFPLNAEKVTSIISEITFDDSKAINAFGWSPTYVLDGFKID